MIFKVGDRVIGNGCVYPTDEVYNGRSGVIIEINIDPAGNNMVKYSENEYWYYKDKELVIDKAYFITSIINDL